MPLLRARWARRLVAVVPCTLLVACATAAHPAATAPVVSLAQRLRALEYVLTRRDSAGVVGLFAPNAFVVTARGDTVRDPHAAARYLLAPRTAGALSSVTSFEEGRLERCTDGVVQVGSYFVRDERAKDDFADTDVGSYGARWELVDGEPRLAVLVLRTGRHTGLRSFGITCPLASAKLTRRRVELLVMPVGIEARGTTTTMIRTLESRGWVPSDDQTMLKTALHMWNGATKGARHDGGLLMPLLAARLRLRGPVGLEGQYQLRPVEGIVAGYSPSDSSVVAQAFEAREASLLLSARWRMLRGAVGPSFVSTRWEQGHIDVGTDVFGRSAWILPSERRSVRTSTVGAMMQGSLVVGASSRVFGEITARVRTGARSTVPGIKKFGSWTATHDLRSLGISLGVAF